MSNNPSDATQENEHKQPPPVKYAESNFAKLADSLKQNMLRRKQAGKNKLSVDEEEQDK